MSIFVTSIRPPLPPPLAEGFLSVWPRLSRSQSVISCVGYTIFPSLLSLGIRGLRCPSLWALANEFHAIFMFFTYMNFPSCALFTHSWASVQDNVISSNGAELWFHFMRDYRLVFFICKCASLKKAVFCQRQLIKHLWESVSANCEIINLCRKKNGCGSVT